MWVSSAAAADDVAAGRRHRHAAEAREQRAGEQDRGADAAAELLVELVLRIAAASTRTSFGAVHSASAPRSASSSTIVSTSRMRGMFAERHRLVASTHGGEDRQRGVLVAGRADACR